MATLALLVSVPAMGFVGAADYQAGGTASSSAQMVSAAAEKRVRGTATATRTALAEVTRTATATATKTASVIAEATRTATATATNTATATATSTATPGLGDATATPSPSVVGLASCTDHDVTKWHGLVKRDSAGQPVCTYGHSHFDDPHTLDYALGTLPYGEISYPWMTTNENAWTAPGQPGKHAFYKWSVYDGPCVASNSALGLRRFRLEAHSDANAGAGTRFHSFFLQAEVCDPNNSAFSSKVSFGGHMDYGSLYLLQNGQETYVPLTGDDGGQGVNRRIHGSVASARSDWTWYGHHGFGSVGLRQEDWGPVDPTNMSRQLFYADPGQNHSYQEPGHIVAGLVPWDIALKGFADRYGKPVAAGCTMGPDCVPYDFGTLRAGQSFQFRADAAALKVRDYDVKDSSGRSYFVWPN